MSAPAGIRPAAAEAPLSATAERRAVVGTAGAAPGTEWVIVTRGLKRE